MAQRTPVNMPLSAIVEEETNRPLSTATTTTESDEPATTLGDNTIRNPQTTINIFNPSGQTSSTSQSDEVTVDGGTGESSDTASQGGATGGGFGGGGGSAAEKIKPKKKKTILPLLIVAAGIAVLIFKPIK